MSDTRPNDPEGSANDGPDDPGPSPSGPEGGPAAGGSEPGGEGPGGTAGTPGAAPGGAAPGAGGTGGTGAAPGGPGAGGRGGTGAGAGGTGGPGGTGAGAGGPGGPGAGGTGGTGAAPGGPAAAPGAAPPKQGLSTGVKLLIGCVGLGVLGAIVAAIAIGVGGLALFRGVQSVAGGVEEHQQASEQLAELQREHPFEAPADGVVSPDQLRRFVDVTDQAWADMEPWADDLRDLERRSQDESSRPGLGDVMAGARAVGGMARARLALADALADHDMSLGEFAWTGLSLARASEARERPADARAGIPPENIRLVEQNQDVLPRFEDEGGGPGRGMVLVVGTLWGMSEGATWQALGLDTLDRRR